MEGWRPDWRKYCADAIAWRGLMKSEAADWLARAMYTADEEYQDRARFVRSFGPEMTKEEKKTAGIRTAAILSRTYWEYLTDKGKESPIETAKLVTHRALYNHYRDLDEHQYRGCAEVQVVTSDDPRVCPAGRALMGQTVLWENRPRFPLAQCDSDICTCSYKGIFAINEDASIEEAPMPSPPTRKKGRIWLWVLLAILGVPFAVIFFGILAAIIEAILK